MIQGQHVYQTFLQLDGFIKNKENQTDVNGKCISFYNLKELNQATNASSGDGEHGSEMGLYSHLIVETIFLKLLSSKRARYCEGPEPCGLLSRFKINLIPLVAVAAPQNKINATYTGKEKICRQKFRTLKNLKCMYIHGFQMNGVV